MRNTWGSLDPNGIIFDAKIHAYLTLNSNSFVSLISSLTAVCIENKNAAFPNFEEKSRSVSGSRLELPTFGL